MRWAVYGVPEGASQSGSLADLPKLGSGTLRAGETEIAVRSAQRLAGVVVVPGGAVDVREVAVIGRASR